MTSASHVAASLPDCDDYDKRGPDEGGKNTQEGGLSASRQRPFRATLA